MGNWGCSSFKHQESDFFFFFSTTGREVRELSGAAGLFNLKEQPLKTHKGFFSLQDCYYSSKNVAVLYSTSIWVKGGRFVPLPMILKVSRQT